MTVNPRDIHVTTVESSNLTEKDNSVNEHDAFFFKVLREEVESHLQDFMKIHLDLACVKLSDTEDELKKTQDKLNDTQETTKTLTMKLKTLQGRFETNMVMTKNESSIFPKRFVWKVSDFSNILSQAKASERERIESDPFYTENYGLSTLYNLWTPCLGQCVKCLFKQDFSSSKASFALNLFHRSKRACHPFICQSKNSACYVPIL